MPVVYELRPLSGSWSAAWAMDSALVPQVASWRDMKLVIAMFAIYAIIHAGVSYRIYTEVTGCSPPPSRVTEQ